jgi:MFS family permease
MIATRLSGMQTFTVIWFGQLVSLVGTRMSRFALMIWVYEQTGSATSLALFGFFSQILYVVLSPFAGVVVDRFDRRQVLVWSDAGAGLMSGLILLLFMLGRLEIWHLYAAGMLVGAFDAFQMPAYSAATTMLIPKQHYARANGMRSLALAAADVAGPVLAGFALRAFGIGGVLLLDLLTFAVAVVTLIIARIPEPPRTDEPALAPRERLSYGWHFIQGRPGLYGLMWIFFGINLAAALTYYGILPAMILARTGGDELALATVQGALGIAGVMGGVLVSSVGLPRKRIHAALGFTILSLLLGDMVRQASGPLGYLITGPLADGLFEPALAPGGALVDVFGPLVGVGPGAGMALMFICTGLLGTVVCLIGYASPAVREVEARLPDYDG